MRVGIVGTGAIAGKHAEAYRQIGYELVACANRDAVKGRKFAQATGARFMESFEELCRSPDVDFVDVCTLPGFRLPIVERCAEAGKHVLVQKPMATHLALARAMLEVAGAAGIQLGVMSQHRFDDSTRFLKKAIADGRLGALLEVDAYVKWHRSAEYYSRPGKGDWAVEGGGALINQAIHQIDLLLFLAGSITEVFGEWQLGALHRIEAEDVVNALLRFACGATGVVQASTALLPGYPERLEIHGTRGSAIVTGDKLTTWDVPEDGGDPPPLAGPAASGASDPMAISLRPFERQLLDFGEALRTGRPPLVSGIEGYRALQVVTSVYASCAEERKVSIPPGI